jgi:hypothetical protein
MAFNTHGEMMLCVQNVVGKPEGRHQFGDLGLDGKLMLNEFSWNCYEGVA